ncbi:hypothetical protein [Streptomyces acidicola]|uniref:hypothetical protein n=1 Tax=Streptomyces acidicola TaxID=2596892 RepID=UPI0038279864
MDSNPWTAKEREAYANDLDDSGALIAVSAASYHSKADQDPTTWQPPAPGYRCTDAIDWAAVKSPRAAGRPHTRGGAASLVPRTAR